MKQAPQPAILRIVFFLALITMYLAPEAQPSQPTPHTLLWRISGKGLRKPSYLYGTMHLNDKRLFQFGDSLYHAIEHSDGLAIEVNPDEMAAYMVNQLFDHLENGKKLENLLSKDYFESHKKALARKFKKPAGEISTSDVLKEKNRWMGEYFRKGEMPTFMDAYLYNIARRQGKWLGGVEDLADQTGLLSELVDQSDVNYLLESDDGEGAPGHSDVEKMIRMYAAQDLEGIEALTDGESTPEYKDKLLLHRNVKMARRIDSLSALRTMVFAVGCAHLPGDSGVIDLLRRRGFTVEPVFSSKKIASSDYHFTEVHLPWIAVTDEQGSYTAEMPANPATVHMYGLVEMKFLMDLFNMSGFCTMSVLNPGRSASKDSLFKNMAEQMFHGSAPAGKNLVKNGVRGKEYIYYDSSASVRLQIFADSSRVYMAVISALKKEVLLSADADKFFQSFTITGVAPPASTGATTFTDSVMGVSFTSPVSLTYNEKMSKSSDESWKSSIFTGVDPGTGSLVMLLSKALAPGYHISDLDLTYKQMEVIFNTQYRHVQKDSVYLDSIKLMHYRGQNLQRPEIFVSATTVVKDGKQTMLMVFSDSSQMNSPSLQAPNRSFHLIPHSAARWENYESPEHVFSVYGPSPIRADYDNDYKRWVSFDSITATSYLIIPDTLGKYAWYSSDSAFWKMVLTDTSGLTVLELKDVSNGEIAGKEFIVRAKSNPMAIARTRYVPSGNNLYKLYAFGEPQLIRSPEVNQFFEGFRVLHSAPSRFTESKAAVLLHDMGSKDSATSAKAYAHFGSAPFREKDAPVLRDALFKPYNEPDDTVQGVTLNGAIARELAALNDSASVDYVRASYAGLVGDREPLRNVALGLLARQHTAYSYHVLGELLRQGPTKERFGYNMMYSLKDSVALAAGIYPSLLDWAKDTLHASAVADVSLALADSGYLSKEGLTRSGETFITAAGAVLPGLRKNKEYDDYFAVYLIDMMGRLHKPAGFAELKEYQSVKDIYLLSETVTQLLEGQQSVLPAALRRLAADPSYRISLYDELKKQHRTALFPREYLTQSAFARASVQSAAESDDDDAIGEMTFVGKRTASFHGKSYVFYLYKVHYPDYEEAKDFLGVSGGFDPAGGLKPGKDLSGVYKETEFDGKKLAEQLKGYLKWVDE